MSPPTTDEVLDGLPDPTPAGKVAVLLAYAAAVRVVRDGLAGCVRLLCDREAGRVPSMTAVVDAYRAAFPKLLDDDGVRALLIGYADALPGRPRLDLAAYCGEILGPLPTPPWADEGERTGGTIGGVGVGERMEGDAGEAGLPPAPPRRRRRAAGSGPLPGQLALPPGVEPAPAPPAQPAKAPKAKAPKAPKPPRSWVGKPVRYKADRRWVTGTVVADPGDGTLQVRLDAGGKTWTVPRNRCGVLRGAAAAPAAAPPPAAAVVPLAVPADRAAQVDAWLAVPFVVGVDPDGELVRFTGPLADGVLAEVAVHNGTPGRCDPYVAAWASVADAAAPGGRAIVAAAAPRAALAGRVPLAVDGVEFVLEIVVEGEAGS